MPSGLPSLRGPFPRCVSLGFLSPVLLSLGPLCADLGSPGLAASVLLALAGALSDLSLLDSASGGVLPPGLKVSGLLPVLPSAGFEPASFSGPLFAGWLLICLLSIGGESPGRLLNGLASAG